MPAFCVSVPVAGSRSKIATDPSADIGTPELTYALELSGLTTIRPGGEIDRATAHAPPDPSSEMQPAVPSFCVNSPVAASRSNVAIVVRVRT